MASGVSVTILGTAQDGIGEFSLLCLSIKRGNELRINDGAATILCDVQFPHDRICGLSLLNFRLFLTFLDAEIIFGSNE